MLLDSNIVIYLMEPGYPEVRSWLATVDPSVSIVTRIEVLGFARLTPERRADLEAFFGAAEVLPLDEGVAARAVALRQQRRMSLGDSVVAATALESGLVLATNNEADFAWIPGIRLTNPVTPRSPPDSDTP